MKNKLLCLVVIIIKLSNSFAVGQTQVANTNLPAIEYAEKIKQLPASPVLDVRTPEEFEKGHLQNARNINWKGADFESQTAKLDKSKPVFVYCLSGKRSAAAAGKMRENGFKEVYELDGGIMKWRAENLPETASDMHTPGGLNKIQFDELLKSDKLVLVDFYADWCEPCKKMKPYLDEIEHDKSNKVKIIRINADDNKTLCKELKIDELPVLQLYKSNTLSWTNTGYINKESVLKALK